MLQELQAQLESVQRANGIVVGELQAERADLNTARAEVKTVQDERDAALQAAADITEQHAAVTQVSLCTPDGVFLPAWNITLIVRQQTPSSATTADRSPSIATIADRSPVSCITRGVATAFAARGF